MVQYPLDVLRGTWLREQISLCAPTSQLQQHFRGQRGFYALSNDLHREGVGKADDGSNDCQVIGALTEMTNKAPVDLQRVDRQVQLGERAVTGAKVVKGDL